MPGPVYTFGGNSVSPGQVSYASLSLTASISLAWPSFAGAGANVFALVMNLTANALGYSITLPNATGAGVGTTALLRNKGANIITILANDGTTITTVAAGVAKFIYLIDNSTAAGSWDVVTFGTGTSAADASLLAGFGLQAISTTLNQSHPTVTTSAAINVTSADLAKVYVATGGSVAANLPASAGLGSNFFTIIKNDGTGTVTLTPSGADTVDGAATVALAPLDSCMVCSLGNVNGWVTIGLGRSVAFAFAQLVKSVAGNTDVTLTSAECANKLMTFTGALTGNINVIVTNTVSVYYLFNNTSGAFSLTVKTAAGAGMTVVQGTHDIGVCDAVNVYRGVTNTAATTAFGAGAAGAPSITFIGSANTGFYAPSAGTAGVSAGGTEVMGWNSPGAAVNWWDAFSSATGTALSLRASGTDPNISLQMRPKGTGKFQLTDGTDVTKVGAFDASGVSTGTTRTVTLPDSNTTIPIISQILTIAGPTAPRTYTLPDANLTIPAVTAKGDTLSASGSGVLVKTAVGADGTVLVADSTQAGGVGWGNSVPTGVPLPYFGATAPSGYVLADGKTIGSAASGATERANADTLALYTLLYNSMANAEAPVSGGRGANAAADFALNKTITIPDLRGRSLFGLDNMGGSAASRVTAGVSGIAGTTLGASGGSQSLTAHTHTGTTGGQSADHTHSGVSNTQNLIGGTSGAFVNLNFQPLGNTGGASNDHTHGFTSDPTGAGASQNVPPAYMLNFIIKL